MATEIVSGRVESGTKKIADMYIRRQGLTPGDVISTVWEKIAVTGEIPTRENLGTADRKTNALSTLKELRSAAPLGTSLATLTDAEIREALASRA